MSIGINGTKEMMDDLAEEFGVNYPMGIQIQYENHTGTYFMVVEGEEGMERVDIEDKYYPIIERFII
jgi:hypothetical protein